MKRLEEIKERCEKATPGPWELQKPFADVTEDGYEKIGPLRSCDSCSISDKEEDAQFVAHSRDDIPWLVSQLEKAIEMAEYYKESTVDQSDFWGPDGSHDVDKKAREFLEQMK